MARKKPDVQNLYYITHVDNVPSILDRGILSHTLVRSDNLQYTPIYDSDIVSRWEGRHTPAGRGLWEYANVYFQPRNPMMYRVVHEAGKQNLAVVAVRPQVLNVPGVFITDGNAANSPTRFFQLDAGLKEIAAQWDVIKSEWWRPDDGSKRRIMAECLVPDRIGRDLIDSIYVPTHEAARELRRRLSGSTINVVPEPNMFFQPRTSKSIGKHIYLVDGDMFFSHMQTLTVSVNLKGIMGKGLASRAKYQFPDVYVTYQDACRKKRVTATRPYLYKRESSLEEELAEGVMSGRVANAVKWFLLFATKRHWRDNSRIEDIEAGLSWLQKNAIGEGIESLAMPALGCGLGGLDWKDVGPVMCSRLATIGIDVAIYLPRERNIPEQFLAEEYLLSGPAS